MADVPFFFKQWGGRMPKARGRELDRACRSGFAVVMWAQLPLAFLMNRLASEPSFAGMAGLSMTLGLGAFFATYLIVGRQQGDG